jgi:hypothetical protein
VGLEWTHAQCLRDIGGVGVGMDGAKLVQRARLVPACLLLPGQVERLVRVLPGFIAASRQTTDLAEPRNRVGKTCACADTFADPSSSSVRPSAKRPWSA